MRTAVLALALVLTPLIALAGSVADQLKGQWRNNIMSVTIDLEKGTYSGAAMGNTFSKKVKVIEETADFVKFDAEGAIITGQVSGKNAILLTKQGGIPQRLERAQ